MNLYKPLFLLSLVLGFIFISSQKIEAAIISLSPEIISTDADKEFTVEINLDTEKKMTDGADVILRYDPEKIEVIGIIPGVTYPDYPIQKIEDGKVSITGIAASTGPFFEGKDLFASVKFKALFGGEEVVSIDFTEESTTESNVSLHEKGVDILSGVENSILYISGQQAQSRRFVDAGTVGSVLLVIVYIIIIAIVGFVAYRYWSRKIRPAEELYTPENVPMDKPPEI